MKDMKKLMLIAGLFTATASFAQPSIGVHGNVIGASMTNKSDEASEDEFGDFKTRISWKLGLVAEIPVSDQFVFAPQLNLLSKGGKIDQSGSGDFGTGEPVEFTLTGNVKMTYLELPLNFAFKSANGFFAGAGPVISYGLGGELDGEATVEFMGETASESFNADVVFDGKKLEDVDDEDVHFKALEVGANVFVGYQLPSGISINLHYNHGFTNIDPNEGSESKNKYFGLGITYFFNRK